MSFAQRAKTRTMWILPVWFSTFQLDHSFEKSDVAGATSSISKVD